MLGYLIDSSGAITEFLGDFRGVAARSGGDVEPNQWLGQPWFTFVQGVQLRLALCELLKEPERRKKVRPHRCDTPDRFRLWQVSVESTGPATRLWFEQIAQRDRGFQPKLDPFPEQIKYCSWCNGFRDSSGAISWLNVLDSYRLASLMRRDPERVEHVLCPACLTSLKSPDRPEAFGHLTRVFAGRNETALAAHLF